MQTWQGVGRWPLHSVVINGDGGRIGKKSKRLYFKGRERTAINMVRCGKFSRGEPVPEFALMSPRPDPINLTREFDRRGKSKSSWGILKSKDFESWIREWSSIFPSALNLLLLMRKQPLVWVNTLDQRGHLTFPSHSKVVSGDFFSKLTFSLPSPHKWAI